MTATRASRMVEIVFHASIVRSWELHAAVDSALIRSCASRQWLSVSAAPRTQMTKLAPYSMGALSATGTRNMERSKTQSTTHPIVTRLAFLRCAWRDPAMRAAVTCSSAATVSSPLRVGVPCASNTPRTACSVLTGRAITTSVCGARHQLASEPHNSLGGKSGKFRGFARSPVTSSHTCARAKS